MVGDPAGNQRSQYDEKTAFDILKGEGFSAMPAMTNDLDTRLSTVESYLLGSSANGGGCGSCSTAPAARSSFRR